MNMNWEKPAFEVADIVRLCGKQVIASNKLIPGQLKAMSAIGNCRTAALGGHQEKCTNDNCQHISYAYNGCRNRHCPKCNAAKRNKWVDDRKADALPVPYFHVVFTIPCSLEPLCLKQGALMYNLLFQAAWQTISTFAKQHKYLGAQMGMVALLHTWGQNLMQHTHLHCLVPAGGIDARGKWRPCKNNGKFFVHVKQLSSVFRGIFTDGLIELQQQGLIELDGGPLVPHQKQLHPLYAKKWVVYAKRPMPTSDSVVEYIGRYSHSVAISNHRIKNVEEGTVAFSWIDYRTSKPGVIKITPLDFLQRFLSHVLPDGFIKIRHFGILASRNKTTCVELVREQLHAAPVPPPVKGRNWIETFELRYGYHPKQCKCCGNGIMVAIATIEPAYRIRQRDGPEITANTGFGKQQG